MLSPNISGSKSRIQIYSGPMNPCRTSLGNLKMFHWTGKIYWKINSFIFRQLNHNYATMTAWLKDLAERFPQITYLYTIGQSVQNRELWVLIVSRNPREHELLRPGFRNSLFINNAKNCFRV